MIRSLPYCSVIIAIGMLLSATDARGDLLVDFNDNDTVANPPGGSPPSPTQSGFIGVTQSGGTFASDVGVGGMITIDLFGGSYDDRDRGQLTGGPGVGQSDLLRDFVFRSTGTALGIELSTLVAGEYQFTGLFHDNTVQQDEGKLGVNVGDGMGEITVVPNFTYSTGFSPAEIGTASFNFTADGINPVQIFVRDQDVSQPYVINGFTLAQVVPEPSSIALWTILGVAALMWGVRLQRQRARRVVG